MLGREGVGLGAGVEGRLKDDDEPEDGRLELEPKLELDPELRELEPPLE